MNCKELEQEWIDRLQSPADSPAVWSTTAEQHFATCAECHRLKEAEECLDQAIDVWHRQAVPAWTLKWTPQEVDSSLPLPPNSVPGPRSSRAPRAALAGLLAACVATLVVVMNFPPAGLDVAAHHEAVVGSADVVVTAEPDVEVTALMSELWQGVRQGSANAAQLTVSTTVASLTRPSSRQIPNELREPMATDDLVSTDETASPWLELGRPVSQQIGAALRFLGDALPADGVPAS